MILSDISVKRPVFASVISLLLVGCLFLWGRLGARALKRRQLGMREAGPYQMAWLGDDDSGRQVASGVYMYVLRTGEGLISRKMLLLK